MHYVILIQMILVRSPFLFNLLIWNELFKKQNGSSSDYNLCHEINSLQYNYSITGRKFKTCNKNNI